MVIWDPERRVTIANELLHHNVDDTPYEGMTVKGWPETVLSRGSVVVERGRVVADQGRGQFLRCERPLPAHPETPRVPV
ncbi:MAG: hypothetical protein V3T66_06535 [Alphaproteobacteria bacterium]